MLPNMRAIQILKKEFPKAEVGINGNIPYARLNDGRLFGCLFGYPKGEGWSPVAIIWFPSGKLDRDFVIHKELVGEWAPERD